jgi:carbonic anhydrase/acetyltransferase-like protein (isoleucine patch superfamily)
MLSLLKKPYAPPRGPIGRLRRRLHGMANVDALVARGLQLGREVYIGPRATIDPWHCWLIAIGDEATLAPGVQILAHDASTKRHLGWTRAGRVVIGRRVFIGAGSIILPDTTIGDDAIGRLVDDPALRARLGAAGRRAVLEGYDVGRWTAVLRGMLETAAGHST